MKTLSGMTGFGRSGGEAEWGSWTWEAKAVNGRGLDVRVNVPSGFEGLDQTVKKLASKKFTRGNMQIGLRIELTSGPGVTVDEDALATLIRVYEKHHGGGIGGGMAILRGPLSCLASLKNRVWKRAFP